MTEPTEWQLIEKIVRAKAILEAGRLQHICIVNDDPYYIGPCRCQASYANMVIDAALRVLKL